MRVRSGALRNIQLPQCPDKTTRSTGTFELKSIVRWLGEMNLTRGRRHSRPPKAIGRAQRAQLGKIPNRLLAERCLPIRSERTAPRREEERNRAFRYSGSGKHSLEVRSCSRPSSCQRTISSVQKNTREFWPACICEIRVEPQGFVGLAAAGLTGAAAAGFLVEVEAVARPGLFSVSMISFVKSMFSGA